MNKRSFIFYITLLMLSGCSSIIGSISETVVIDSAKENLYVEVIDSKDKIVDQGRTPLITNLKKGRGYFKREHYKIVAHDGGAQYVRRLVPGISATYFLNLAIPFAGEVGMATVDPYLGTMWTFSDERFVVDEVK